MSATDLASYRAHVEALGQIYKSLLADYSARAVGQPAYSKTDIDQVLAVLHKHSTALDELVPQLTENKKVHDLGKDAKILWDRGQHVTGLYTKLGQDGFADYLAGAGWVPDHLSDVPEVKMRLQKYRVTYEEAGAPKGLVALATGYGNDEILQHAKDIDDLSTIIEGVVQGLVTNKTITDLIDDFGEEYRSQLTYFLAGAGVKGSDWRDTTRLNKLRMAFDDVGWDDEEPIFGLTAFTDGLTA